MSSALSYLFVFITVFLTVYGQIVIKWQVVAAGAMPADLPGKLWFLGKLLLNPWILSGLAAGLLAAVSWMAAMTRLELSHAYPFMSPAFIGVLVASALVFHEPVNAWKIGGLALITLGIIVGSQG
jgi:multidrug transporter EmrE-like cation transporter